MLVTEKEFRFETSHGTQLCPYIREFFTSESQTLFTWPCAVLLASYIVSCDVLKGCSTIELGAGCGLPSIVAALSGAKACVITERAQEPLVLQNLEMNVAKNGLKKICSVIPLDWKAVRHTLLPEIDVILGADIFYSSEDFESIIAFVDEMMSRKQGVIFYTTYQERSTRRSIAPYLDKYDMSAEIVPLESFLHISHRTNGLCSIVDSSGHYPSREEGNLDGSKVKIISLATFDSMLLLKITKKR